MSLTRGAGGVQVAEGVGHVAVASASRRRSTMLADLITLYRSGPPRAHRRMMACMCVQAWCVWLHVCCFLLGPLADRCAASSPSGQRE